MAWACPTAFASARADKLTLNLYWQQADGTGDAQRLMTLCCRALDFDPKRYPARAMSHQVVERAKALAAQLEEARPWAQLWPPVSMRCLEHHHPKDPS